MKISKATLDDAEAILKIQKLVFLNEGKINGDINIPPLTQTIQGLKQEFPGFETFIGIYDGKIIGSIRGQMIEYTAHISRLMVAEAYQNKGFGKELMTVLETYMKDRYMVERFELFTGKYSEKSIYFYKKLGYKIFMEDEELQDADLVFMEKHV